MGTLGPLPRRDAWSSRKPRASVTDREYLGGPLLLLWLASGARVILTAVHHAAFDSEATLALVCVIVLPLAAVCARRRSDDGARSARSSRKS